jgi:8-oxo-dGTP diphosphatase
VGVLVDSRGRVLLADRPAGKPYAGYWEFPGGKIEPGEDVGAALARELHEELGIDIGPSEPWVTFEFDYPHAYVELQFRITRLWQGVPHAREGQRLRFVNPEGELPQPLLPAAVPVLRWLRLPRTLLVTDTNGPPPPAAGVLAESGTDPPPLVIVDADWRARGAADALEALRRQPLTRGRLLLLASGPGADSVVAADGLVFAPGEVAAVGCGAGRLCGAWISSVEQLRVASAAGCDFALAASPTLSEALRAAPPLPTYLPAQATCPGTTAPASWPGGHGRWIDLRRPTAFRR